MRILFVMSTFLYQVVKVLASGGCRDLDFLECIENKALVNHTIHTSNVLSPGLEQCQHQCFMNDECVSYNLSPTRGMMRTCELSDTDHVGYPDHVILKEGFEYCPIKNPCKSSSCTDDEICKPDFSWDSFICIDKKIACRQETRCPIYNICVVEPVTKALQCQAARFSDNCTKPLGMQDGRIPDSAITASSVLNTNHGAHLARLHNFERLVPAYVPSAWTSSADVSPGAEHLQVDLRDVFYITKVATQGKASIMVINNWVKRYTLRYSRDGSTWADYLDKDTGLTKEFIGNTDQTTVVEHILSPDPIKARQMRFVILVWNDQYISMRVELYGCKS